MVYSTWNWKFLLFGLLLVLVSSCGKDKDADDIEKKDFLEKYRVQATLNFEDGESGSFRGNTNPVIGARIMLTLGDRPDILTVKSELKKQDNDIISRYNIELNAAIDTIGIYEFNENFIAESGNVHINKDEYSSSLMVTSMDGQIYGLATNNRKKIGNFTLEIDSIVENRLKASFYGTLYNINNGKELHVSDGVIDTRNLEPFWSKD